MKTKTDHWSLIASIRQPSAHRSLWHLAAPMMLSNISIATLGLVDTAVIGHLSDASCLGGIAIAAVVFDFLYWGVTFLRMGTTGVVAQVHGARDVRRMVSTLRDAMIVALSIAAAILFFRQEIIGFALNVIHSSEQSAIHAAHFFSIKIWGAPGVLATMVFIGWLIGMQNARSAMWLAALPCILHAGLDVAFVTHLKLGVAGAGYAAVATAYFSAGLGLMLVNRELSRYEKPLSIGWQWSQIRQLLSLNSNILIRTLCLIATFAFFTHQGARQGDTVLAANAVLLNFQMLTALALDGFANALEALVGAAIGASNRRKFVQVVSVGALWSLLFATLFMVLYLLFGHYLIALLTSISAVRMQAERYLIWAAISPLVSVWCFLFDGIFIGATKGREMRNSMIFSSFFVFAPAWVVLERLENNGLWLAFLLFFAARGLSMGWYFVAIDRRGGFVPASG
ncbi:MAG: MATE family efflux transporter [Proteobacteria bacterium]|nr:MATE family efflux transporter [Pseudomonadota bacterium]